MRVRWCSFIEEAASWWRRGVTNLVSDMVSFSTGPCAGLLTDRDSIHVAHYMCAKCFIRTVRSLPVSYLPISSVCPDPVCLWRRETHSVPRPTVTEGTSLAVHPPERHSQGWLRVRPIDLSLLPSPSKHGRSIESGPPLVLSRMI